MATRDFQFEDIMIQYFKEITLIILTFFCFEADAWAQIDLPKNEDGSVDREIVITSFESYLDTVAQLPSNPDSCVVGFLLQVFHNSDSIKIRDIEKELNAAVTGSDSISHYEWSTVENCCQEMKGMVMIRKEQIQTESANESFILPIDRQLLIPIGLSAAILLVIIIIIIGRSKKKASMASIHSTVKYADSDGSDIVVRNTTSAIQRRQNIDDVIGNENYLQIGCNNLYKDSTVRNIYIKASCVKEIYNMYANDLRNPDNPKEDGCMVLGRWIHDTKANEYFVTLEHVVLPGNDAVFTEYELNFGGKIKMDVREKLRKLRLETGLQYDMTCWVHSHPGLGVFFSNNDCNVQNLLKHPTHPNFLTALVVDILTPEQDLGIFTFKHDGTINARSDMKRLYSLEEWYQWAVEQERNSFKAEDYRNSLENAKQHGDNCYGIELSNGAIIDMGRLAIEHSGELVTTVYGYPIDYKGAKEYVAVRVTDDGIVPNYNPIGCFVMVTHCSIPSVKKAVAQHLGSIKFVLVYSSSDGLLTSIPVVDGNLCTDENYYGEQKLEDLKIWTRRKR